MSEVKMEEGHVEEDGGCIHPHCSTCIKVSKCNIRQIPGNSCEIMWCEAECGARFHACKYQEHKLLCANEKVPCINAVNGCPIWLARRDTGRHLATCPASVVHCTMEWNRWPVCSRERQMHIPFHQPNPNARAGQLDVALALRDQRMLNEWLRAPRKTRRALRNSLTRRFPAVPLQLRGGGGNHTANGGDATGTYSSSENSSTYPSRTITDDEEDTPWEVRKTPPGLQRSVCGELYRASKQTTESLTAALTMITNGHPVTSVPVEGQERNILSWLDYVEDKENRNVLANGWSRDHGFGVKNSFEEMDVGAPKCGGETCGMDQVVSISDELDSFESPGGYDVLFVDHTVVSEISSASMTDHARKQPLAANPPPPPTSPPLFVNLGLDLTLESITRYQTKPKSMYTFLCAQEFRRDEYSWHYKNIHSDIHGGLNGWLEQRCPLAHYGCMFSFRRFFPTCCGSTIVHNDILESFGVQPYLPNAVAASVSPRASVERNRLRTPPKWAIDSCPMDVIPENKSDTSGEEFSRHTFVLSELPFEVLQHVARFLDSFSLCNLSMTSRLFRDVSCSLLEERGIVVQQWEQVKCGKKSSWRIAYKRWFFSTAFTPIRQWGFEDKENMANHLKSCIYFQRCFKTDPYFYPVGINPNPVIYEKLKAGVEEALRAGADAVGIDTSTKL